MVISLLNDDEDVQTRGKNRSISLVVSLLDFVRRVFNGFRFEIRL